MGTDTRTGLRVGVYVDVANLTQNGGYGMQFSVLRDFACRGGAEPIRLNVYTSFDELRAEEDEGYANRQRNFFSALRDQGYKVIEKRVKWYTDEFGTRIPKANVDLDLAVDALLQSDNMDRVLLATGDGDFVQVVRALQNKGCRVEIVAFDNVSRDLRREADQFVSGYLIPNLLPIEGVASERWGKVGSSARGICYSWNHEKRYGFIKYLASVDASLFLTDTRQAESPYRDVFCHLSELPQNLHTSRLPSRDIVLEFRIAEGMSQSERQRAVDVRWVNAPKELDRHAGDRARDFDTSDSEEGDGDEASE